MASSAPPDDGTAISKGGKTAAPPPDDSTPIPKDSGKTAVPLGDSTAMASAGDTSSETAVPPASNVSTGSAIPIHSDDNTPVSNPSVTGYTGSETAAPIFDSIAISKPPVTGDTSSGTGISDFDLILKTKDRTISDLEGKVRIKDVIIGRFKEKVKDNISEIESLKEIIAKKDMVINLLNGNLLNSDEVAQNLKGMVKDFEVIVQNLQGVIELNDRELEKAKEKLSVIPGLKKDLDRKKEVISRLNATLRNSKGLKDGIETKDREIELLVHKLNCMEDEHVEFEGMEKVLEAKNLVLEVLESRLQHMEHECEVGSDEIIRQFKELLVIGEMSLKEKRRMDAKFDELELTLASSEGEIGVLLLKIDRLEVAEEDLNHRILGLQDQIIILKEEMCGNSLEYAVAITCYAEAYKELKAWLKEKCKEIEDFFKKQQDIIDS